jgi:hypothetical protein
VCINADSSQLLSGIPDACLDIARELELAGLVIIHEQHYICNVQPFNPLHEQASVAVRWCDGKYPDAVYHDGAS